MVQEVSVMRPFRVLAAMLMFALMVTPALAAGEGTWGGGQGGAMQGQEGAMPDQGAMAPSQGGMMEPGAGGAAPGLSEQQLGPCSWVITGQAMNIQPDQNKLVVSTDKGPQPLDVTSQSRLLDKNANEISLSDIKPGQRVVVGFHRENGKNIVGRLYQVPKEAGAAGEEAKPHEKSESPSQEQMENGGAGGAPQQGPAY
jgi:hypothetical protein